MNFAQIETALGLHLRAMPGGLPIAWANDDREHPRPFLMAQRVPVERIDDTLAGDGAREEGFLMVTVVTGKDQFTTQANEIAAQIMAWFPKGLRLTVPLAGRVLIDSPPTALTGFNDGPDWRQPVRVTYQTESL